MCPVLCSNSSNILCFATNASLSSEDDHVSQTNLHSHICKNFLERTLWNHWGLVIKIEPYINHHLYPDCSDGVDDLWTDSCYSTNIHLPPGAVWGELQGALPPRLHHSAHHHSSQQQWTNHTQTSQVMIGLSHSSDWLMWCRKVHVASLTSTREIIFIIITFIVIFSADLSLNTPSTSDKLKLLFFGVVVLIQVCVVSIWSTYYMLCLGLSEYFLSQARVSRVSVSVRQILSNCYSHCYSGQSMINISWQWCLL